MTDEEITRLRTLAQAATPGPWQWDGNVCDYDESNEAPWLVTDAYATGIYKHLRGGVILKGGIKCLNEADAAYIAAASPDVVLALLDRQRAAPRAEPVAWITVEEDGTRHGLRGWSDGTHREVPLYTSPPAPSAEPVITDAQVAAAERELWMGGMRDVPSEVVRLALRAALGVK
jgi:hypothetical protein